MKELIKAANRIYYNTIANDYDRKHPEIIKGEKKWWEQASIKHIKPMSDSRNITVLDIGTGTGFVLKIISKYIKKKDKIMGCDISTEMIKNINDFTCFVCDAQNIPLENNSIDIITMNSVLHHVPDHLQLINEINRILKPEGLVLLSHEPNKNFFKSSIIRFLVKTYNLFGFGMKIDKSVANIINKKLKEKKIINKDISQQKILELIEYNSVAEHRSFKNKGFSIKELLNQTAFNGYKLLEYKTKSTFAYKSKIPFINFIQDKIIFKLAGNQGSLFSAVLKK